MSELTQAQKYHFRRELEQIAAYKGSGTELVTVYVPPERLISDITNYLRNELGESANIKSKSTRKNVMGAIESMISRLKNFKETPPNGLACFVGEVIVGNNQTDMVAHLFEPPQPVPTFYYRCDNKFFLDPLEGMMTEKEIYGLILIDRREFTVGILKGKQVTPVTYRTSQVPGKHGRGGQSQRRFERATEEAAQHWYKECGEKASEIFLQQEGLLGVFLGGPGPSKRDFIDGKHLHHELEKKIVEPYFDTGYTDEHGLKELAEMAAETQSQLSLGREKKLMQRLMREITKSEGGLSVYGEDHVRAAIMLGALDVLLISEDMRRTRLHEKCNSCAHEDVRTIKSEAGVTPETTTCPECGSNDRVFLSTQDVVEELSTMAEEAGGTVELIGSDSEEGEMLLRAFGGVAGIMRYKADVDKMVGQIGSA
ncbi:MAG: peptide chain release factor aRF-1 [Euryarchaeota archaeon]|nr:peptide chain release factor aRF-1 [Euryarchaeota archaeon]